MIRDSVHRDLPINNEIHAALLPHANLIHATWGLHISNNPDPRHTPIRQVNLCLAALGIRPA